MFLPPLVCFSQTAPAQSLSTEATSVLVERTQAMIKENRPDDLIPLLRELLVRVRGNTDGDALQTKAFCMYQIGVCQMSLGQYADAIKSLDLFIGEFPKDSMVGSASVLIAECYAVAKDWSGAEKYARARVQSASIDPAHRMTGLQILAEALYNQQKWAEAATTLQEIYNTAKEPEARKKAAIMLLMSYANAADTESFMKFLVSCDESIRQDAGVNGSVIQIADQKRKAGRFVDALVLYRSVLLQDDLIRLYQAEMAEIQAVMAKPYSVVVGSSRSAYEQARAVQQARYDSRKKSVELMKTSDGYDMDILFRIGQCYVDMKRNWPAYTLFRHMCTTAPKHALAEDARFQTVAVALDLQKWSEAVEEAQAYLKSYPSGRFADEVSLNLMQTLLQEGRIDEALAVGFKTLERSPSHRFMDQIKYLMGYIHFQKMEYTSALPFFQEVFEKWPDGVYREASDYWIAMCRLFLGQYDQAIAAFEAYLHNPKYPEKRFAEDASYRIGIALYGAGRFGDSQQVFRRFVADYPASDLLSEAYSMLGDLRGAEGELEPALEYYGKARDAAANIEQANYAVFQSAKVYELQKNHDAIIRSMEEYLKKYGDTGNYAGAGFWIGKAHDAAGRKEKSLETYVDTVVRFGDKPENDDVDLILKEMIKQYSSKEGWYDAAKVKAHLKKEMQKAEREERVTVALRLATLLAQVTEGEEHRRYLAKILSEGSVTKAGALTLLVMANAAADSGNDTLAHQIFEHCMKTYAESEIMIDIMNIELRRLFKEKAYDKVIALAEEIANRFGYRPEVGITRKLKADALRLSGQYEEAVKTYQELFAVREWRGPLTPEALYWIGMCNYQQGKPQEAFAFFQRVYVLYENHTEWVAKAYDGSILCLEKLGRTEDMIRTCREMLANPEIAATPEGRSARARLDRLAPEGGK